MKTMKKRLLTLALALLATVAVLALSHETAYAISDTDTAWVSLWGNKNYDAAFEVLYRVNQERVAEGLNTLVMDQNLMNVAMQRAAEIAFHFDHERPNGTRWSTAVPSYYTSYVGENIAGGYNSSASVMEGWMNSQGHRNNILNANYTCMGVGCFYQPCNGSIYWVQVFSGKTAQTVVTSSRGVAYEQVWVEAQHQKLDLGVSKNLNYLEVGDSTTVTLQQNSGVVLDPSCLYYQVSGDALELANDGQGTVNAVSCGAGTLSMTLEYNSGEKATFTANYQVKPSAPEVTGSIDANGKPTLSWTEVPGVTGYQVYRAGSDGFLELVTGTSYTDTSAVPGRKYNYYVLAYKQRDSGGHLESEFSSAVTLLCRLPSPSVSTGSSSQGGIRLSWKAVDGAVEYEVYRSGYRNGTYTRCTTVTGTGWTDTGATPGYTYYYKVRALTSDGTASEDSAVVSRVADCAAPKVSSKVVASSGAIKLSWSKVTGAGKYYIYRSTDGGKTYSKYTSTTSTSWTNKSVTPGKTYYYKVKAVCSRSSYGNSVYSNVVYRTADCARPVVKISNVSSTGKLRLTWDKVTGATKYEIYRATSKNGTFYKYDTTTSTSYTNTSVTPGKTYYYKVKAICGKSSYGNSAFSTVVSRTADCAKPVVTIQLNGGKPQLKWSAVDGASKYYIYRSTDGGKTYSCFTTVTATTWTNKSAKSGTTYYYKVVAVCGRSSYGNSAYSNVVSARSK